MTHLHTTSVIVRSARNLLTRLFLVMLAGAMLCTTLSLTTPEKASASPGPFYWIVSVHSGLPIMPLNHSRAEGVEIVQTDKLNAGAQHWKIKASGTIDGQQRIRRFENRHTKNCVSNFGSNLAKRVLTQQQCHTYTSSEQWVVSSAADMWAGRPFRIWNQRNNLCMDVQGGSTAPYTRIIQYHCHGGANQLFRLEHVPGT